MFGSFCLLSHFWLPQVLRPSIPPLMVINICWLAWEESCATVPVFSAAGTVTSSGAAGLGAAGCSGCEDLWQGVCWVLLLFERFLHCSTDTGKDEAMEVNTNEVHHSNFGQSRQSPWESSSLTETTLACFCLFHCDFFSVSQKYRIFPWNKNDLNYKQLFTTTSIYPLSLIISEDTML